MKSPVIFSLLILLAGSCNNHPSADRNIAKAEIIKAEEDFARMVADSGIAKAFVHFADNDAVILRGNRLIPGIDSISRYFGSQLYPADASLIWTPDFVDVASSCDLGYSYGRYTYTATDTSGTIISSEGIFHTVWKRGPDRSWKFVWD